MLKLMSHQEQVLKDTTNHNKVAYFLDMGLGKTFVGAEKLKTLNSTCNLLVCQKSKIQDWIDHFQTYYPDLKIFDCTAKKFNYDVDVHLFGHNRKPHLLVINYELAFRRPYLKQLKDFTLMLDESSLIQNETAKRSKFILSLKPDNIILLSGAPVSGKYENLVSQIWLLGWNISKKLFWQHYIDFEWVDEGGFFRKNVIGYKNVERLKRKLRQHGAVFMKSEDVLDLPEQIFTYIKVKPTKEYRKFLKDELITIGGEELVGDSILKKMLYCRMLCGQYNREKLEAFKDLVDSTGDRLIVFYNFNKELGKLIQTVERPISIINGEIKDLSAYENESNSISFIQYQAGAMGLNLQKANKIIYFTPTLSSDLFEQSKKRVHRIGQNKSCFYYRMITQNSIEEQIYRTLEKRKDYTDELFKEMIK